MNTTFDIQFGFLYQWIAKNLMALAHCKQRVILGRAHTVAYSIWPELQRPAA